MIKEAGYECERLFILEIWARYLLLCFQDRWSDDLGQNKGFVKW